MFPIKLILGISTEGYYQFDMTKPQLDLRTLNDVKFWLLSYWFQTSIKLKLNSKLQMLPIDIISTEGYYQFDMTKPRLYMMSNFATLIPVSDIDQTQLKIETVSDQTHIRYINLGILPVQ